MEVGTFQETLMGTQQEPTTTWDMVQLIQLDTWVGDTVATQAVASFRASAYPALAWIMTEAIQVTLEVTRGAIMITLGAMKITPGDIMITLGAMTITRGDTMITPGDIMITLGVMKITPGDIMTHGEK